MWSLFVRNCIWVLVVHQYIGMWSCCRLVQDSTMSLKVGWHPDRCDVNVVFQLGWKLLQLQAQVTLVHDGQLLCLWRKQLQLWSMFSWIHWTGFHVFNHLKVYLNPSRNCIETDMFQMMFVFVLRSTLLLQHLFAMFDSTARQPLLQALLHMVSDIALKAWKRRCVDLCPSFRWMSLDNAPKRKGHGQMMTLNWRASIDKHMNMSRLLPLDW